MRFLLLWACCATFLLAQPKTPPPTVNQDVFNLHQLIDGQTKPLKEKDEKLDNKLQDYELKLQKYENDLSWFFTVGALVLGISGIIGGVAIRKWVHDSIEKQVKTITEATLAESLADMKRQVQATADASIQELKDLMLQKTADVETHLKTKLESAETEIQKALNKAETEIQRNADTIMKQTAAEINAKLNPKK